MIDCLGLSVTVGLFGVDVACCLLALSGFLDVMIWLVFVNSVVALDALLYMLFWFSVFGSLFGLVFWWFW